MTNPSKCDTCRARKIKCDEARPSCGQCDRKGRPCNYSDKDPPRQGCDVRRDRSGDLVLLGSRRAPMSNGLYTTLSWKRKPRAKTSLVSKSDRGRLMDNTNEWLDSSSKDHAHYTDSRELSAACSITKTRISPSLTSRNTRLAGDLIASLEVSDLRYTIRTYAVYFEDLPRRIGSSKALDTSIEAFTGVFRSLRTGTEQKAAMEKYGQALKALKESLYDPVAAYSSATLCSVHLLWIAQIWLGDNQNLSHAEGLTRILNYTAMKGARDPFDFEVMTALASLVAFESAFNPNIELDARIIRLIPNATSIPTRPVQSAERFETFQPWNWIRMLSVMRSPETQLHEVESVYERTRTDLQKLSHILYSLRQASDSTAPSCSLSHPTPAMRVKWACSRTQGILLLCALTLNQYLCAANWSRSSLVAESRAMVTEIITHARQSEQYRPIGSSHMLMCLAIAMAAASTETRKAQVEGLWNDYRKDYPSGDWVLYETAYKQKISTLCSHGLSGEQRVVRENTLDCHVQ